MAEFKTDKSHLMCLN